MFKRIKLVTAVLLILSLLAGCGSGSARQNKDEKVFTIASSMNLTGAGVRTSGICVVTRYPHSQSSVVSAEDIEGGIDLMNAFSAFSDWPF